MSCSWDGSGNVGTFIVWNLAILNRDPVTPEEIADKVGGEGWSLTSGRRASRKRRRRSPPDHSHRKPHPFDAWRHLRNRSVYGLCEQGQSGIRHHLAANRGRAILWWKGPVTSTEKGLVMDGSRHRLQGSGGHRLVVDLHAGAEVQGWTCGTVSGMDRTHRSRSRPGSRSRM